MYLVGSVMQAYSNIEMLVSILKVVSFSDVLNTIATPPWQSSPPRGTFIKE